MDINNIYESNDMTSVSSFGLNTAAANNAITENEPSQDVAAFNDAQATPFANATGVENAANLTPSQLESAILGQWKQKEQNNHIPSADSSATTAQNDLANQNSLGAIQAIGKGASEGNLSGSQASILDQFATDGVTPSGP